MKKALFFAAVAALVVSSCGTTKVKVPTGKDSATGIQTEAIEGSLCYELQEQKPTLRSVGSGLNHKEASAKQRANANAMAEYANKIGAAVEAACEIIGINLDKYAGDDVSGMSISDQSEEGGTLVNTVAKQTVKNTTIIKTERYYKTNKQYLVYVCIEFSGDLSELLKEVEDNLKEKITEADRQKLEARHDEFRKRMETKMNSL